jgi:hypothetical protein
MTGDNVIIEIWTSISGVVTIGALIPAYPVGLMRVKMFMQIAFASKAL